MSARAALTAAFCLSLIHPLHRQPREILGVIAQGTSFSPMIEDPTELVQLAWLEARVRARMGGDREAESALLGLRDRAFLEARLLDSVLLTLDLLALRIAAEDDPQDVLDEIRSLQWTASEAEAVAQALRIAMKHMATGDPWWAVTDAAFWVRHLFRLRKLPVPPLPFS